MKTETRGGIASALYGRSGTPTGAKFTPVDDQVRDLLETVYQKYGSWSQVCRSLGFSDDTVWQLKDGGTNFVSNRTILRLLGAKSMPPIWKHRDWGTKGDWMRRGRWGRGPGPNYIKGNRKRCTGPKHPEGGGMVPLSNFLFHKTGKRAGKPFSRCKDCHKWKRLKTYRGIQGRVRIARVRWVFIELERRIGRREVIRRGQFSHNIWARLKSNRYIYKWTAYRAIILLREVREEQGA